MPGMAAVLALARHETLIAALLLSIVAVLVLKANFSAQLQSRSSNKPNLTHSYKMRMKSRRSDELNLTYNKVLPTCNGSRFMEEMSV